MTHTPKDCPGCGTTFMPTKPGSVTTHLGCILHQSAPALLEALKAVLPYADSYDPAEYGGEEPTMDADIQKARDAIEAAKGDA